MNATANRYGFIVLYPNGTGVFAGQRQLLTFNAGVCCGAAMRNKVDDVGLTEAILTVLEEKTAIDAKRIFATGMSNGGMMAHRLASDSTQVAAVASVAGQLAVDPVPPVEAGVGDGVPQRRRPTSSIRRTNPPCPVSHGSSARTDWDRPVGGTQRVSRRHRRSAKRSAARRDRSTRARR